MDTGKKLISVIVAVRPVFPDLVTYITRGCHTHSFCTTICDHGQNESQRSYRNIHRSQRSSHYISVIFAKKLVKVKGNVGAKS